jgi:hypothetical protein
LEIVGAEESGTGWWRHVGLGLWWRLVQVVLGGCTSDGHGAGEGDGRLNDIQHVSTFGHVAHTINIPSNECNRRTLYLRQSTVHNIILAIHLFHSNRYVDNNINNTRENTA